jgi:GcrA cell cycle regulator
MEWNDETVTRLISLWAEGHSTAEIGRRISVSKNAVVGKAHRLNLPARPSPIRREGVPSAPRAAAPRRVIGSTLPPLSATLPADLIRGMPLPMAPRIEATGAPHAAAVPPSLPPDLVRRVRQGSDATAAAAKPAPVRPMVARATRTVACCWPIGEPGTKSFRFCDANALPGKPYCAAHAQIAYVKVRDRREEAA